MTPNQKLAWPIAWDAVAEIARSEGCKLKAYRCPAGVLTIAWGRTNGVKAGDTCTQEQADQWLLEDLAEFEQGIGFECFADEGLELEVRQREQADRLLQLRRHHQRLGLPKIETRTQRHRQVTV